MRSGSTGDPFTWYSSHPAKCGPLTSHRSRAPSAVRMNAPFRVPTRTRTPLTTLPTSSSSPRTCGRPKRTTAPDAPTHRLGAGKVVRGVEVLPDVDDGGGRHGAGAGKEVDD